MLRRPVAAAAVGLTIVAVLAGFGSQLNTAEAPLQKFPGSGTAIEGRETLAAAGITPGVMKPIGVLVERGGDAEAVASRLRSVPGVVGASVIWQDGPHRDGRGVPGDRRRRARHRGDPRPRGRGGARGRTRP